MFLSESMTETCYWITATDLHWNTIRSTKLKEYTDADRRMRIVKGRGWAGLGIHCAENSENIEPNPLAPYAAGHMLA